MIKTTYVCDRCAQEQGTTQQFWSIGVWAAPLHGGGGGYSDYAQQHKLAIQVCRPCLEALGVNVSPAAKGEQPASERTTEDILTELLERIGK
jgi:sulfur relay (sulfurtransferase) complex TusBCD TusD component (DsrE family)